MAKKRKIPARKHHGVRDPLKQLEVREKKLKHVVNGPPDKINDQKLSYKFQQFKKLADQAKSGQKIKRIHSGIEDKPKDDVTKNKGAGTKAAGAGNKFKQIKQMTGEDDLVYLRRVNRITSASLKEAQYEAKYGVKVVKNPKTGEISIKKKPLNEIDELLKQKKRELKGGGKVKKRNQANAGKPMDPKLAKQLIKQAIQEDEEEKKQEQLKQKQEYQHDFVKFGEIVHAPPALTTPRKATKNETVSRPGKKNNLLLQTMLKEQSTSTKANSKPTKIELKGKRKDLPNATRNMLENERQKFVDLYRSLKKSKEAKSNR